MFKWLWDRYFFTGFLVFWLLILFTLVVLKVFGFIGEIPNIPASTGTTFGSMFGVGVIIELIRFRNKVSKGKKDVKSSNSDENS